VQMPGKIVALACKGELTFAATATAVIVCRRIHHARTWDTGGAQIVTITVMGELLLCLCSEGQLLIWNAKTLDPEPVVRVPCCARVTLARML
jgi:hypothetical protein